MSQTTFDVDPANLDPNGICENQTAALNAALVLNGALCDAGTAGKFEISDTYSSGCGGIKLLFASAGNIGTVVFTITGKDENGITISPAETVTGVATTAVSTVKYYSEITAIGTSAAAVSSNVFIGTVGGELVTRTVPLNKYAMESSVVAIVARSGIAQFRTQEAFDDLNFVAPADLRWMDKTGDAALVLTINATAARIVVDSYTDGAEFQAVVSTNPFT